MKSECNDCAYKAAKYIKYCLMTGKNLHVCPEGIEISKCKGYKRKEAKEKREQVKEKRAS